MISAVVLTKNEEKAIKDCLKALSFCSEIIVIDDYSLDQTVQIAQKLGAKVFKRHLNNNFSAQRNFGLIQANNEWVLFIDADERVPSMLKKEILSTINKNSSEIVGYYLKRQDIFLGKKLNFGETSRVKLLRLAKKKSGLWHGAVHEKWQVKGKKKTLKNPLLHNRGLTLGDFLRRINFYTTIRSSQLYEQEAKSNILEIFLYPMAKFLHNYIFRLGMLDQIPGFLMAAMMSLHSFMVRSKLWVRQKNQGKDKFTINDWQKYA